MVPFGMGENVVEVLVGRPRMSAYGVGNDVLVERDERGDAHVRRIHARHQTCPRRGRYRAGVGVGHHDAHFRQTLHVRSAEAHVVGICLLAESERRLGPAEIVHQKEQNVGALLGVGVLSHRQRCEHRQSAQGFVEMFHAVSFKS